MSLENIMDQVRPQPQLSLENIIDQVRPPAPRDPGRAAQAVQRPRRVRGSGHLQAVQGCAGLDQDLPDQRAHAQPEAHQSRYRSSG